MVTSLGKPGTLTERLNFRKVVGLNVYDCSLPAFTKPARRRWESIPADIRQRLLSNVWCAHCSHETTITNFTGTIKAGDLLLVGQCAECQGDVARVIEGS
jgi:hypothetical protein